MMPGVTFEEISNQIIDAYSEAALEMLLRVGMNLRLDRVVNLRAGTWDYTVFQLLRWSEMHGREVELIQVTAKARPEHQGMRAIYQKYGLAVPVFLQKQGTSILPEAQPATDSGFEVRVKQHLPNLDVGLWREQLFGLEGRVCRVEVGNGAMGTGFLVGPDTVLTNYHVLESVLALTSSVDKVRCRFDYKKLPNGTEAEGTLLRLHPSDWRIDDSPYTQAERNRTPDAALPTTDELDYALVRLERPIGREPLNPNGRPGEAPPRGWVKVPAADPALTPAMALLILQHPNRQPLQLALDTNAEVAANANNTRVRYATNTEGGASGSPCFDINWNLIALHHYGDPDYKHPKYNQGVPIGAIRDRLKRNGKEGALGT
jgi:hypothetical protein